MCAHLYEVGRQQGTMYGMLLESVQHYIQLCYGEDCWLQVLDHVHSKNVVFTTHKRYSDSIMVNIANACAFLFKDRTADNYMRFFGQCFVDYFTHYGYDKIVRVAGRHYRDFLNGIDNLHETMRFSYPKMLSPSFYVDSEDVNGCNLHYRSKRSGFTHYVIGQLKQCGKKFYDVEVTVTILQEERTEQGIHVVFRLDFDNQAYHPRRASFATSGLLEYPTITTATFFKVFPFSLVFNKELVITHLGETVNHLFSSIHLQGKKLDEHFHLRRPQVQLAWENVLCLQKVVFELESISLVKHPSVLGAKRSCDSKEVKATKSLLLKGQMRFVKDLEGIAFLCSPMLSNLEELQAVGLYINDLNMHDSSRDMVMAGYQHASRLEYSIEKQIEKSKQIAMNMAKLDEWRQKSNELLYSMIPRSIAVRLKNGEDPINTCEMFDQVTILFCYMIGFTDVCAQAGVMELVECINSVFTVFDAVVDKHNVFKVETLGDAVYMVAGGVPDRRPNHAILTAKVALELIDKAQLINSPIMKDKELAVRIGMHTGSVVAGVVGKRMPQYCLFGDTVNTASRMQTYSEPGRIHISEPCQKLIKHSNFVTVFRGRVDVKGKGQMNTYWLAGLNDTPNIQDVVMELRQEQTRLLTKHATKRLVPEGSMFDLRLQTRRQSEASLLELGMATQAHQRAARRHVSKYQLGRMGTSEIIECSYEEHDERNDDTQWRKKWDGRKETEGDLDLKTFPESSDDTCDMDSINDICGGLKQEDQLEFDISGTAVADLEQSEPSLDAHDGSFPEIRSCFQSEITELDDKLQKSNFTPSDRSKEADFSRPATNKPSIGTWPKMTKTLQKDVQNFLEKSETWEHVQQAINDLRRQFPKVASTGDIPSHKNPCPSRHSLPTSMQWDSSRRRDSLPVQLAKDITSFKENLHPRRPSACVETSKPEWFQELPEESGKHSNLECPQLGPCLDQAVWKDLLLAHQDYKDSESLQGCPQNTSSRKKAGDACIPGVHSKSYKQLLCPFSMGLVDGELEPEITGDIPRSEYDSGERRKSEYELSGILTVSSNSPTHKIASSCVHQVDLQLQNGLHQEKTGIITFDQEENGEKEFTDTKSTIKYDVLTLYTRVANTDSKQNAPLQCNASDHIQRNTRCEDVFLFDSVGIEEGVATGDTFAGSDINESGHDIKNIQMTHQHSSISGKHQKLLNNREKTRRQQSFEDQGSLLLNGYLGNNFVDDTVSPLSLCPSDKSLTTDQSVGCAEVLPVSRVRASTVSARPIPRQLSSHPELRMSRCESAFAYLHSLGGHPDTISPSSSSSSLSRKFQSQNDLSSPIDINARGGSAGRHPSLSGESQSPNTCNFFIGSPAESPQVPFKAFGYQLSQSPPEGATTLWTRFSPPDQRYVQHQGHHTGSPSFSHTQLTEKRSVLARVQESRTEPADISDMNRLPWSK